MASTFFGLETAKRGMVTQQSALYVTGHNIANANTEGYTRQRVNFSTTTPYAVPGLNRPNTTGQLGTGVEAGSIQRVRDSFADLQYRTQNNKLGYYGVISESLTKMEEVMNEPSDSGLQKTMDEFWNALQTLTANPENSGARSVVASTGQMVADTFNYYYDSLTAIQDDIGNQIDVTVDEINTIIDSINQLNKQISEVEPHGMLPNDLYDARDVLVDQLSNLVNIQVERVVPTQYGMASAQAEGLYNIEMIKADGSSYGTPINLLEVTGTGIGTVKYLGTTTAVKDGISYVNVVGVKDVPDKNAALTALSDFNFGGELAGLIDSYGYQGANGTVGYYPDMFTNLNNMAKAFADEFNRIHADGYALNETKTERDAIDVKDRHFFEYTAGEEAKSLAVLAAIINNSDSLRAGKDNGDTGNNENIQRLANLKTKSFGEYGLNADGSGTKTTLPSSLNGNLDSFYSGIIGSLGVDSQSAQKNLANATTIAASVEQRRQSTSSVSLDEEMVNMISFQHAYNASARMITVVDETLDKIINGMGVVGR
ncbi:MAG: flagellar hook-associated protein FlgK [Bacillus sp. (in: firmicutes)]